MADALITNRDGIVGTWVPPAGPPNHLPQEDPQNPNNDHPRNMERWARERREQIIDFEMLSRLAFSAGADRAGHLSMAVWHAASGPPRTAYRLLARLTRPSEAIFHAQLDLVIRYADLRPDRAGEILAQLDGPADFYMSIVQLHPERSRWTLELLDAVARLAQFVEMRLKHALSCRRPIEYSPQVQPMILTPAHGSLPSGHATEAFAAAIVLMRLLRSANPIHAQRMEVVQLLRQAARVAINRQVAGVHFPVDTAAGALLGLTLGEYLTARFSNGGDYRDWWFNGEAYPDHKDFDWREWFDPDAQNPRQRAPARIGVAGAQRNLGDPSPTLEWLWNRALAEWA